MGTINDLFVQVAGDDATVSADKTKLDADTTQDVSDHADLNAAVVANGPTLVKLADGTPVALIPQPDGTIENLVLKDGTAAPLPPAPNP